MISSQRVDLLPQFSLSFFPTYEMLLAGTQPPLLHLKQVTSSTNTTFNKTYMNQFLPYFWQPFL